MEKKLTSYQKLKLELKESKDRYNLLYSDFKKFAKNDPLIKAQYCALFAMDEALEKMNWMGESNKYSKKKFDGIIKSLKLKNV